MTGRIERLISAFPGHDPDECVPHLQSHPLERLVGMQRRFSRHYFRLLEADGALRARRKNVPRNPGEIAMELMDQERRRLAEELHGGAGQALGIIIRNLDSVRELWPEPPAGVRERLDRIGEQSRSALEQVRGVSRRLYAPAWQALPLVTALRQLWEASVPGNFEGSFELQDLAAEPPPEVRAALYLAGRDCLSNVMQHSGARRVRMASRVEDGRLSLAVEDDGHGFDAGPAPFRPSDSAGVGLRSMYENAHRHGGDLQVESSAAGTKITISFPVNL